MSNSKSLDYDTSDHSRRHVGDAELRECGFRIHTRPEKGPALWDRSGKVYTEERAKALVFAERKK